MSSRMAPLNKDYPVYARHITECGVPVPLTILRHTEVNELVHGRWYKNGRLTLKGPDGKIHDIGDHVVFQLDPEPVQIPLGYSVEYLKDFVSKDITR